MNRLLAAFAALITLGLALASPAAAQAPNARVALSAGGPPSIFDLDFVNGRYSLGPARTVRFQALPSATYTGGCAGCLEPGSFGLSAFSANEPRVTTRGYWSWAAATNLLLNSSTLTSFTPTNATNTTDGTLAPDGLSLARKVAATASASTSYTYTVTSAGAAAGNCYSIHAKQGSGPTDANYFALRNTTTATDLLVAQVNLSTGAIAYTTGSSGVTATAEGASGWWRISLCRTTGIAAGDNLRAYAAFVGAAETAGEYAYLWNAQLETGIVPTGDIPTVGVTVTRPADAASLSVTAPRAWTLLCEATFSRAATAASTILSWSDASLGQGYRFEVRRSASGVVLPVVQVAGFDQITPTGAAKDGARTVRTGLSFNGQALSFAIDGVVTDAALSVGSAPAANAAWVGRLADGTQPLDDVLSRCFAMSYAAGDNELARRTSAPL